MDAGETELFLYACASCRSGWGLPSGRRSAPSYDEAPRGISSGHPLRLGSHYRLKDRRQKAMRDTSGRDNLCSWLFKAGVLIAWCRHRPTRRKT